MAKSKHAHKRKQREKRNRQSVDAPAIVVEHRNLADGVRVIDRKAERATSDIMAFGQSVDTRAAHHNIPRAFAKTQEAGTELGRLWKAGKFTDAEMDAGRDFAELVTNYLQVIGAAAPTAQAQDMNRVHGEHDGDNEDISRSKAIRRAYETRITPILLTKDGHQTYALMRRLCVVDENTGIWTGPMFSMVKRGLAIFARGEASG